MAERRRFTATFKRQVVEELLSETSTLAQLSRRGVQYASHAYVDELREAGIEFSMARKDNPYDNATAESFMKTLEYEEVYLWDYRTVEDVRERIPYFLEEI